MKESSGPLRLQLGSGSIRIPGYLNVDMLAGENVDLIADAAELRDFKSESVRSIYACHVLEHFSHENGSVTTSCVQVLERWFELLEPEGELFVAVPDLRVILKALVKQRDYYKSLLFLMAIYGGQNYSTNVHYCGFTKRTLTTLLLRVGFKSVLPFQPFVNDTTKFCIDGVKISLNLRASKSSEACKRGFFSLFSR